MNINTSTVPYAGLAGNSADNPWEQTTLTINKNLMSWGASVLLHRGMENEVIVEAPPEVARQIRLAWINESGLIIDAQPDFETWVTPVDGKFHWKLTPEQGKRGRGTLVLYSREVNQIRTHEGWVLSQDLSDEVNVLIDGNSVPESGAEFFWSKPGVLTLRVDPYSPVASLPISLNWISGTGLTPDDFDVSPELEEPQAVYKWTLTGQPVNTGTFDLAFVAKGFPVPLSLDSCKLLDRARYKVLINGQEHQPGVDVAYPVRDREMSITLIRDTDSKSDTEFSLKRPSYAGSAISDPAFGVPVPVGVDGHTWKVKFSGSDRPFILGFEGSQSIALNMSPGYHSSAVTITPVTFVDGGSTRVFKVTVQGAQNPGDVRVSWDLNGKVVHYFSRLDGTSTAEADRTVSGRFSAWIYIEGEPHSVRTIQI